MEFLARLRESKSRGGRSQNEALDRRLGGGGGEYAVDAAKNGRNDFIWVGPKAEITSNMCDAGDVW